MGARVNNAAPGGRPSQLRCPSWRWLMTEKGHEDSFPPRRQNARGRFDQETCAGVSGNGRDACAVRTSVAGRPPHRSRRAGFPHPAPTSGV